MKTRAGDLVMRVGFVVALIGLAPCPAARAQATLTWSGNDNAGGVGWSSWTTWTNNWNNGGSTYIDGSNVVFDGGGTSYDGGTNYGAAVWETQNYTVGSMSFSTRNYTIGTTPGTSNSASLTLTNGNIDVGSGVTATFLNNAGAGGRFSLAGSSGITKTGAGTLALNLPSSVSGATAINGGTVSINAPSADNGGYTALGTGAVTINNGATLVTVSNWATGNEWNGGNVGTITVNAGGTWTVNTVGNTVRNGLVLNGGTVNGTGANGDWGGMYLRSTSVTAGGTAASTVAVDTAMNGATTMTVDAGSQLNYSGVIHNSYNATAGIAKAGAGTLALSGANTYTGQTDITAGTLVAANNTALGAGGHDGNTMSWIRDGATLALQGGVSFDEHFHVWGTGVGGLGAIRNLSGTNALTDSPGGGPGYCLRSDVTVGVDAGSLAVSGFYEQGGAYGLTKVGAGPLTLTAECSYTGGTTVNAGTLLLPSNGGRTRINGALTVNAGGTVETTGDGTGLGYSDQISSVGINGGTVTAAGAIHIWNITGGITMTGGTLQSNGGVSDPNGGQLEWNRTSLTTLASANTATIGGRIRMRDAGGYGGIAFTVADGAAATDLLVSAAITQASGGMGVTKSGAGTLALTGVNTYTGTTSIAAGTLQVGTGGTSGSLGPGAVVNNGTLAFSRSDGVTVTNGIAGSGGLRQIGSGTLTLGGANTYTGATAIEQGTLTLLNPSIVGSASYTTASGVSFAPASNDVILGATPISNVGGGAPEGTGTVATLTDGSAGVGASYAYTVSNGQVITYQPTYRTNGYDLAGINIYSTWNDSGRDQINLSGIAYSTVDDPGTFVTIPGSAVSYDPTVAPTLALAALSASGGSLATRVFQVRFNFGPQENNYAGYAQLEVVATPSTAGPTTNVLPAATALHVAGGATLDLNGVSQTVAALTGAGSVVNRAGSAAILVVDQAGAGTFSGAISGTTSLTKAGAGALNLTGTSSYTGATAIDAGTLLVNGALGNTAVVVADGARLGGSGLIGGSVSVLGGGIVGPGNSPGTLTVSGAFSLMGTSALEFDLLASSTTVGGGVNDLITGVTDLVLDGQLNIVGSGDFTTVAPGTAWRLFDYSGTLTDNTLELGSTPSLAGGLSFVVDTSTANQVNLIVVPEPGGILLAGVAVALAAGTRLRRRRPGRPT